MYVGRFASGRLDDVIVFVQEGWFSTALLESLLEVSEQSLQAVLADGKRPCILADMRPYTGGTLVGQLKLEGWLLRRVTHLRKVALVTHSASFRALINASANFVPGISFRLAVDEAEALTFLERPDLAPDLATLLAHPPWRRPV